MAAFFFKMIRTNSIFKTVNRQKKIIIFITTFKMFTLINQCIKDIDPLFFVNTAPQF